MQPVLGACGFLVGLQYIFFSECYYIINMCTVDAAELTLVIIIYTFPDLVRYRLLIQ
jgi:hypothetical protein